MGKIFALIRGTLCIIAYENAINSWETNAA